MDKKAVKKYDVAQSTKLGRYLVAAKNLSAGELIFREDALAVGPSIFDDSGMFCFACMRPLPDYHAPKSRYACSKCNVAPLCNRLCETTVGLHSSKECSLFREKKDLYLDNIEELVRILLHLRLWLVKDENQEAWDRVMNMEAHLDERKGTEVWQERKENVIDVFEKFELVPKNDESSDALLQRLCGVIDVNTFELRSPGGLEASASVPLLRGLFLEASLMAHECLATAHVAIDDGFRMALYAAVPLSAGQPITFHYTSPLLGTIARQEHLQVGKYFRCECAMCRDPLEKGSYLSCILCPRCKKDYVAIQKPDDCEPYGRKCKWQCQKCKRTYRGCLIKSAIDISSDLINSVDDDNLKAMECLLDKLSRTFHKNHYILMPLKKRILGIYRNEMMNVNPQRKILQKMIDLCKDVLSVLEIVEPGISTLKGIVLYEMHFPMAMLANRAYASREISARGLLSRLEEAQGHLKRSLTMLLLEPATTPEGLLAKRALQEMKLLARNVEDAKCLCSQEEPKKPAHAHRRHGRSKNKVK